MHHRDVGASASIGIAIGDIRYALADEILRDADVALYRAKALGRGRFELRRLFFSLPGVAARLILSINPTFSPSRLV